MPWYRMRTDLGGPLAGPFHLHLDRRHRTPACGVCGYIATRQCDWKLLNGRVADDGGPPSCDRWICEYCSTPYPGDKDLCPEHELEYRAWLARRTNSTDGAGP